MAFKGFRLLFLLAWVWVISASFGCNQANSAAIQHGLSLFRERATAQKYAEIYEHADAELRRAATESSLAATLGNVHARLGKAERWHPASVQQGWFTGRGTLATVVYDTEFERGRGTETFVWKFVNDEALLVGYHVSSDALEGPPGSSPVK